MFLEIVIRRTASLNQHIDPLAATRITEDRYVDDLSTGGSLSEVDRFMGKSTVDLQQDGTIPQILAKGSLRLKVMVSSGESNPLRLKMIGSKILGVGWNLPADQLSIKFAVSLLNKNEKSTLVVTDDNFATFNKDLLTPRNLLRIVNGV